MKRCQACGAANGDQARFCIGCGARLEEAAPAAESAPAPNPSGEPTIRFECPACRQHLAAEPDMAGDTIACPQCGRTLAIPAVSQLAPAAPPVPAAPPPPSPEAVPAAPVPVPPEAAVPDPAAGPGEAPARRRPRLVGRVAVAAVLVVALAWGASAIVPGLLPGAVKMPPAGWVPHEHRRSRSIVFLPPDWERPTMDQAISRYGVGFDPNDTMLLVRQDKRERGWALDQVVQITFFGWRGMEDLKARGVRGLLEDAMPKEADLKKESAAPLSREIHKLAGGTAAEVVVKKQGKMLRLVWLVAGNLAGSEQMVHLTCQADADEFERFDAEVFRPMLESFLYCTSERKARAACKAAGVTTSGDGR